jgi:hypothetical protein
MRRESCPNPQRIHRFDEHSVGTYVSRAGAQDRRTPFDLEVGAKRIARCPAPIRPPGRLIPTAHGLGEPPCQGSQGAAPGRSRRLFVLSIRLLRAHPYDAGARCFVPSNAPNFFGYTSSTVTSHLGVKRRRLVLIRRSRRPGGIVLSCGFFSGANSPLHFRLQILAKTFRDDSRRRQFAQIGNRKFGQVRKHCGQR